jgi:hypothetical protein
MLFNRKMLRTFPRLSALAGVLAFSLALSAATLLQLSNAQLVSSSTAIVLGTVTASHTALNNRTIFTHYTVQVSEQWKGTLGAATGATVDVALPGGALNGVRQSYPGVPTLQVGSEYVLFLWTGKSGMTQITGFDQGVYLVGSGGQGQLSVSRPAAGEMMVGRGGQPVTDHAVSMGLNDFKAMVRSLLPGAGLPGGPQ